MKKSLQEIGIKYGTDKATYHKFCDHYEEILQHFLQKEHIKLLEIGVHKGASIRMWHEYFQNAEIHCVDIDANPVKDLERVTFHNVNCDDLEQIKQFASIHNQFDIIIDDGGHTMKQQQNAFNALWKNVNPGGVFIIEDLHTSYGWKGQPTNKEGWAIGNYNLEKQPTTYQLVKSIIDKVDFESKYINLKEYKDCLVSVENAKIIEITKLGSATSFIRKKSL